MSGKHILAATLLVTGLLLALVAADGRASAIGQAQSPVRALPNAQVDLGSGFTYQGYVEDNGNPINDSCDFTFALYDAATGGAQLGATETETSVSVSEGRFTVLLNDAAQFGDDGINGQSRWLEVALRCPAGAGSYTILSPRQALSASPYALSLQPGATISGTVPLGAINLNNSWSDGIYVSYAGYNGLDVVSAGQHGVLLRSVADDGVYVGEAGDDGIEVFSASDNGLRVNSVGDNGVSVGSAGSDGFYVTEAGNASTLIPSVLNNGFEIAGAEGHGLFVGRADFDGMRVDSAGDNGVVVNSAGERGMIVNSAAIDGIFVGAAGGDGYYIGEAGTPSSSSLSPLDNGFEVAGAAGNGLFVGRSDQSGVHVQSAGWDGLAVNAAGGNGVRVFAAGTDAGDDGLQVDSAGGHGLFVDTVGGEGVRVYSSGDDGVNVVFAGNPSSAIGTGGPDGFEIAGSEGYGLVIGRADAGGMWIDSAGNDGINVVGEDLAGYFFGDVEITGACIGCTQAIYGLNSSEGRLEPGAIVSLKGTGPAQVDTVPLLLEVEPAQPGEAVIGVVQGRAELITAENRRPEEMEQRLVPREGAAEPGEYVTIIIYGLAQVQASALEAAISAGDRLTVNGSGAARRLQTRELDGMIITEGAPTIGTALEELGAGLDGLIWVLVGK